MADFKNFQEGYLRGMITAFKFSLVLYNEGHTHELFNKVLKIAIVDNEEELKIITEKEND